MSAAEGVHRASVGLRSLSFRARAHARSFEWLPPLLAEGRSPDPDRVTGGLHLQHRASGEEPAARLADMRSAGALVRAASRPQPFPRPALASALPAVVPVCVRDDVSASRPGHGAPSRRGGVMDVRKEVEFFDQFAAHHHDYDVLGPSAYARLVAMFTELVRPKPHERCIDLGCGTGAFTRQLRPLSLELSGMDISPASIARANELAKGERYIVGDIRETHLADGSFDIVVLSGVLHHLHTREIRREVLREAARLLAPGGRTFSFDPSAHSPSMRLYRDPRSPLYSSQGKTENEVLLDRHELAQDLRDAGLQ